MVCMLSMAFTKSLSRYCLFIIEFLSRTERNRKFIAPEYCIEFTGDHCGRGDFRPPATVVLVYRMLLKKINLLTLLPQAM